MQNQPVEQIASSVAKELFDAFEKLPGAKTVPAGTMIYQQQDPPDAFYFLKEGKVRVYVASSQGDEKNLAICSAGEIFGQASFFDRQPRMSSAAALKPSTIITVGRNEVLALFAKNPNLALSLIQYLSQTVRKLSGQVGVLSFLPADKRIASYLLAGGGSCISQTHEQIAKAVGASRVTVSRVMSRFAQEGWLATTYGKTHLLDAQALAKFCEEIVL